MAHPEEPANQPGEGLLHMKIFKHINTSPLVVNRPHFFKVSCKGISLGGFFVSAVADVIRQSGEGRLKFKRDMIELGRRYSANTLPRKEIEWRLRDVFYERDVKISSDVICSLTDSLYDARELIANKGEKRLHRIHGFFDSMTGAPIKPAGESLVDKLVSDHIREMLPDSKGLLIGPHASVLESQAPHTLLEIVEHDPKQCEYIQRHLNGLGYESDGLDVRRYIKSNESKAVCLYECDARMYLTGASALGYNWISDHNAALVYSLNRLDVLNLMLNCLQPGSNMMVSVPSQHDARAGICFNVIDFMRVLEKSKVSFSLVGLTVIAAFKEPGSDKVIEVARSTSLSLDDDVTPWDVAYLVEQSVGGGSLERLVFFCSKNTKI